MLVAARPRAPLTRTRSLPRSSRRTAVKSATTSGVRYRAGIVHLVKKLVPHGVEVDATAGAWRLGDDGGAVRLALGDRVGQSPRLLDRPPVAGEVAASRPGRSTRTGGRSRFPRRAGPNRLAAQPNSWISGARNRDGSATLPVITMSAPSARAATIGRAPRYAFANSTGPGRSCHGCAGVRIGERAGNGGELCEPRRQVVAGHGGDPQAGQAKLRRHLGRLLAGRGRIDPPALVITLVRPAAT